MLTEVNNKQKGDVILPLVSETQYFEGPSIWEHRPERRGGDGTDEYLKPHCPLGDQRITLEKLRKAAPHKWIPGTGDLSRGAELSRIKWQFTYQTV